MRARTGALRRFTWQLPLMVACLAAPGAAHAQVVTIAPDEIPISCRESFEQPDTIELPAIATGSMTHALDTIDMELRGRSVTIPLQRYRDAGYVFEGTSGPGRHRHTTTFTIHMAQQGTLLPSAHWDGAGVTVTFTPTAVDSKLTTDPEGMNGIVSDATFEAVKRRIPVEGPKIQERFDAAVAQVIRVPFSLEERRALTRKPASPKVKKTRVTLCGASRLLTIEVKPFADNLGDDWPWDRPSPPAPGVR